MSIDIDYINPVISGLEEAFCTMLDCKIERTGLGLMENNQALHPVSGIIGISGKGVGTIVLSMSEGVAIKAASTMLMTAIDSVDVDVLDAVGELTNMIAGNAKAQLEEYKLSLSLPNVIHGRETELRFPENSQPFTIPFSTDYGKLAVEIGFSSTERPD